MATDQTRTIEAGIFVRPRWQAARAVLGGLVSFARTKPLGFVSAMVILGMLVIAIFAPLLAPFDPTEPFVGGPHLAPSSEFWFGTDVNGRDVMSRAFFGARLSMYVGFVAVGLSVGIGTIIGLTTGFFEGKLDLLGQRIIDAVQAFPALILALGIIAVRGPSLNNALLVITIVLIPGTARIVRGAVISIKQNVFIEASRALGASNARIMFRHILPNVTAPIIIQSSILLGGAILFEASLSFLGAGASLEEPSWGAMISGRAGTGVDAPSEFRNCPWLVIVPAVAISLAVFSFNLLGDAIRDVLDPRLRGTGGGRLS